MIDLLPFVDVREFMPFRPNLRHLKLSKDFTSFETDNRN